MVLRVAAWVANAVRMVPCECTPVSALQTTDLDAGDLKFKIIPTNAR